MTWPSAVDYRDALQHIDRFFTVAKVLGGRAETNHLGVPRPRSGASAHVYKVTRAGTRLAVRVFLYPSDQREWRYVPLDQHLRQVRTSCLVHFEYHPRGIKIDRAAYPVLLMDWVEGVSLGEWVRAKVRQGDLRAVRQMSERWIALMRELRDVRVAHGDLQHDNVMVVGDQLK